MTDSQKSNWRPTLDERNPSVKEAADMAAQFVADIAARRPPYWLTFLGIPGVGKTMLARQIFEEAKKYNPGNKQPWIAGEGIYREENRRPNCVWMTANGFADKMRRGDYDLPEYLRQDFIVVLDDLGAARDKTDFVADAVYRLADHRIGRWMVWTANLSLADVAVRIDARVSSRLIRDDNRFITINGPDYSAPRK